MFYYKYFFLLIYNRWNYITTSQCFNRSSDAQTFRRFGKKKNYWVYDTYSLQRSRPLSKYVENITVLKETYLILLCIGSHMTLMVHSENHIIETQQTTKMNVTWPCYQLGRSNTTQPLKRDSNWIIPVMFKLPTSSNYFC